MADTEMPGGVYIVCEKGLTVLTHMLSFSYLPVTILLPGPWVAAGRVHPLGKQQRHALAHQPAHLWVLVAFH